MNIFHSYYRFWRNFEGKSDYCWVAITKTIPQDYVGNVYRKLAPIGENFENAENPFNEKLFFNEYAQLLKSLDRNEVIADLKNFSKKGKDVIILNWEDLSKNSEGRFAFAWMFGLSMEETKKFDLEYVLKMKERQKDVLGFNFLEI